MILVKRMEEGLTINEIYTFEAKMRDDGIFEVGAGGSHFGKASFMPKEGECIDVVDGGKRIVSIMRKKVRWYGAAPK